MQSKRTGFVNGKRVVRRPRPSVTNELRASRGRVVGNKQQNTDGGIQDFDTDELDEGSVLDEKFDINDFGKKSVDDVSVKKDSKLDWDKVSNNLKTIARGVKTAGGALVTTAQKGVEGTGKALDAYGEWCENKITKGQERTIRQANARLKFEKEMVPLRDELTQTREERLAAETKRKELDLKNELSQYEQEVVEERNRLKYESARRALELERQEKEIEYQEQLYKQQERAVKLNERMNREYALHQQRSLPAQSAYTPAAVYAPVQPLQQPFPVQPAYVPAAINAPVQQSRPGDILSKYGFGPSQSPVRASPQQSYHPQSIPVQQQQRRPGDILSKYGFGPSQSPVRASPQQSYHPQSIPVQQQQQRRPGDILSRYGFGPSQSPARTSPQQSYNPQSVPVRQQQQQQQQRPPMDIWSRFGYGPSRNSIHVSQPLPQPLPDYIPPAETKMSKPKKQKKGIRNKAKSK